MSAMRALSLLSFAPSGKDYEASSRLFASLGFEETWESDGYAGFRNGNAQFILQRLDDPVFAASLMIKIVVQDLDSWWLTVSRKQLENACAGLRMRPPTDYPWGREVHFIDLAGVCWHVGEA